MLLTPEQLQEIRQIILDHHQAYVVNNYGVSALAPEIVSRLRAKGMVNVRINTMHDAFVYGALLAQLGEAEAKKMTFRQFKAYVTRNPMPLSSAEQHAVQIATTQAGKYAVGLGNRVDTRTGALLVDADKRLAQQMRQKIRTQTAANIASRGSIENLRSELGHATKDWTRDLGRIAITETQNAMSEGLAAAFEKKYGSDALVCKRPSSGCCDLCRDLCIGPDGAPRIFRLSDLQAQGSNYGRKSGEMRAVVGAIHPNCVSRGTSVMLAGGSCPIEYVQPGDWVWTHRQRLRQVTHVWCAPYEEKMLRIETSKGWVRATPEHPFWDGMHWQQAASLKKGDRIMADATRPRARTKQRTEGQFLRVLHGHTEQQPFLALMFHDAVYMHEGFVYRREYMDEGPIVPSLRGRLRFRSSGLHSISGGNALTLCSTEWVDDCIQPLIFNRCSIEVAHMLRLRCIAGGFASLAEQRSESIAAATQTSGDGVEGQPILEMPRKDSVTVQFRPARRATARARGAGQSVCHEMPVASYHAGDGAYAHAAVVEQSGDSLGTDVESVCAPWPQKYTTQRDAQDILANVQTPRYSIQGFFIVEMASHKGVYVDTVPFLIDDHSDDSSHMTEVPQALSVVKVTSQRYRGLVYNLTVDEDESFMANGLISHNCRCALLRVPDGAGFNAKGTLMPGGKRGILTDPETMERIRKSGSQMRKAMYQSKTQVAVMGVPVSVHHWNVPSGHQDWVMTGSCLMQEGEAQALVGPDMSAAEAYIVHGNRADAVALGFSDPEAAYAAHEKAGLGDVTSMEALSIDAFRAFLAQRDAERASVEPIHPGGRERIVLALPKAEMRKATRARETPFAARLKASISTLTPRCALLRLWARRRRSLRRR
ncbi:MAG: hypothetical protein EOO77_12350 [Oxalobacteraceae bacterium]|nr:MAG: hypothetical protein EOO77_12350 [Oxalobacteraceae bacterium]